VRYLTLHTTSAVASIDITKLRADGDWSCNRIPSIRKKYSAQGRGKEFDRITRFYALLRDDRFVTENRERWLL
jgi:hypothetical protein